MEYSFLHCSRPWLASQDPILKPDRGYPEPLVPRFSHGDRSSRGASDPTRRDHSESIGNTTYTNRVNVANLDPRMEAVRLTEACHTEGRNGARARSINGGLVQPATGREGRETGGETERIGSEGVDKLPLG